MDITSKDMKAFMLKMKDEEKKEFLDSLSGQLTDESAEKIKKLEEENKVLQAKAEAKPEASEEHKKAIEEKDKKIAELEKKASEAKELDGEQLKAFKDWQETEKAKAEKAKEDEGKISSDIHQAQAQLEEQATQEK